MALDALNYKYHVSDNNVGKKLKLSRIIFPDIAVAQFSSYFLFYFPIIPVTIRLYSVVDFPVDRNSFEFLSTSGTDFFFLSLSQFIMSWISVIFMVQQLYDLMRETIGKLGPQENQLDIVYFLKGGDFARELFQPLLVAAFVLRMLKKLFEVAHEIVVGDFATILLNQFDDIFDL